VLPLLYLHGASAGDFVPVLGRFLGSSAGLSASVITRLTEQWKAEQCTFAERDLSGVDYVYLWADGVHVNIRLQEHRLCLLVMIGVRADGRKELIALADGYRESTESWAGLLRECARRRHAGSPTPWTQRSHTRAGPTRPDSPVPQAGVVPRHPHDQRLDRTLVDGRPGRRRSV
jgi:hypothetical protein